MKHRNRFHIMAQLTGLVKPLTGWMILAVTLGVLGHLCASFITISAGYGLLVLIGAASGLSFGMLAVGMLVMAAARAVLRYGEQSCNHFIAFQLLALIRDKVFAKLRMLAPAKLESKDKGDLIALITADIELLEVFYAHTISPAVIALIFSALMVGFIGHLHWMLGWIALLAYAVIGIAVPLWISQSNKDDGLNFRKQAGELSGYMLANLRGLNEILQYNLRQQRMQEMKQMQDHLSASESALKQMSGRSSALSQSLILLFDLAMLFASAWLMLRGQLDFPKALLAVLAMFSSFGPVSALAALGSTLQNTFAAGSRVLDLLEEEPLTKEISGQKKAAFDTAALHHVTFAYPSLADGNSQMEAPVLEDVTLETRPGEILGISGRSGSGKSTLLKLLMRFWDPESGRVQIGKDDVRTIDTASLRDVESLVTQQTHLFHDTIKNNLKIAKPAASDEEIIQACQKAAIHDFIMQLPNQYDTLVGELGSTLSGGEKQRLGLARAFLHDAPFMMLDEPTSNLDALNEAVILRALDQERAGKTIALVSHRKSTMGIANRVLCMENGRQS